MTGSLASDILDHHILGMQKLLHRMGAHDMTPGRGQSLTAHLFNGIVMGAPQTHVVVALS